jgi:hypothetical protein
MQRKTYVIACIVLLVLGIGARLLPHLPNATPITALAFAGSLYFGKRMGLFLPLAALFISDAIIGFYDIRIMASVYISFALIGVLSSVQGKDRSVPATGLLVLASPILFFIITNFAVWMFSPWYEKSFTGLMYAYELAIPFLRNMMIGDILYTSLLLGVLCVGIRTLLRKQRLLALAT